MVKVKLISSDGVEFVVDREIVQNSTVLAQMFDLTAGSSGEVEETIPMQEVDSKMLKLVLEWSTHHFDELRDQDSPHAGQQAAAIEIGEWDKNFVNGLDQKTLNNLMKAANFLEVSELSRAIYKTLAEKLRGKSSKEMRSILLPQTDPSNQIQQVSMDGPYVTLQSSDGIHQPVPFNIARSIPAIKTMMEEAGVTPGNGQKVEISNVNNDTLIRVLKWVAQHQVDTSSVSNELGQEGGINRNQWQEDFLKELNNQALMELILAAGELQTEDLVNVACETLGNMLNGKTADQIRGILNVKDDITELEKEEIRKQNLWVNPLPATPAPENQD